LGSTKQRSPQVDARVEIVGHRFVAMRLWPHRLCHRFVAIEINNPKQREFQPNAAVTLVLVACWSGELRFFRVSSTRRDIHLPGTTFDASGIEDKPF